MTVKNSLVGQDLPDGLDALRCEMQLAEIMRLIERTARWVDPETFNLLPAWYPEHARRAYFFKGNWSEPQMNKNRESGQSIHKYESNTYANMSLTQALGLRKANRPNWSCCHIWGVDDTRYQTTNAVVQDRRFYSCVANMVLLPTPLKAFTDVMPEVKTMLRICTRHLYNWVCDHESVLCAVKAVNEWDNWSAYPSSWPRPGYEGKVPLGIISLNERIRVTAERRIDQIRADLSSPGPHYPADEVQAVLTYWSVTLQQSAIKSRFVCNE